MISKEKLQEVIDEQLAQAIANQVFNRMEEQWHTISFELATTRKVNEALTKEVEQMKTQLETLVAASHDRLEEAGAVLSVMRENNRKASEILKAAAKELGLGE
jgi:hypothetical protein